MGEFVSGATLSGTRIAGQVAIVTGGGRGLGRSMAQRLAADGMTVAVAARSAAQLAETVDLIAAQGGRAQAFPLDVTDQVAVEQMVAVIEHDLGAVELLVNNAAIITPLGPVWEVDPDAWWQAQAINVRGPFLCARAVLPRMIARRRGRIINVASGAGLQATPYGSAYVTSKTALIRLSETMALETREFGIAVFAIDPGLVRTAMSEYLAYSEAGQQWIPLFARGFEDGRDVPPEHAAELVRGLNSGKADVLSGTFLRVTDDLDALIDRAESIQTDNQYRLRLRTEPQV